MSSLGLFFRNLFIPHEGNNYKGKSLHINFLTYYLIGALVLIFATKIVNTSSGNVLGFATDITVNKLFQLTNNIRQENSVSPLSYNQLLAKAAEEKAQDMFSKNYWSHYAPDGKTPWDFILSTGYQYEFAGENLAKNFLFSQDVINAWMNSPSHKENMLRKDYTEVGFAVANGILNGEETTLVVQMFGKPLENPIVNIPVAQKNVVQAVEPIVTQPVLNKVNNTQESTQSVILAQKASPANLFPKLSLSANIAFLLFLFIAISMDIYFAAKLHIIRIGSKNLAHLIFISFLIIGLIIFTKGSIL